MAENKAIMEMLLAADSKEEAANVLDFTKTLTAEQNKELVSILRDVSIAFTCKEQTKTMTTEKAIAEMLLPTESKEEAENILKLVKTLATGEKKTLERRLRVVGISMSLAHDDIAKTA